MLWVEYIQDHPNGYRYSRFCELYQGYKKTLNPTMRQTHRVGEKIFVDFSGKRPGIVDPKTGEVREVELFVGDNDVIKGKALVGGGSSHPFFNRVCLHPKETPD